MKSRSIFLCSILVSLSKFVYSQDYSELGQHKELNAAKLALQRIQQLRNSNNIPLREIPKKFEINGENPGKQLAKMATDIQKLADQDNVTISYVVKVDMKPLNKKWNKKATAPQKKNKSKKYNVPLKKKNMRLSNFEIIMKKLADANVNNVQNKPVTTEEAGLREQSTTIKIPILKYKPIISRVKTNYAKKSVKPVKTNEFTLPNKRH